MPISYRVYFNRAALPPFDAVRMLSRHLEADFEFSGCFDFGRSGGYCPCLLKEAECGFEWACGDNGDGADFDDGSGLLRGADSCATLTFRPGGDGAVCAVAVCAALALLSGGAVLTPEKDVVSGDDIPDWSQGEANGYRIFSPGGEEERGAEALLEGWLGGLENAGMQLLPRFDAASPRIILTFPNGVRLIGARWTLQLTDGGTVTTRAYPPRNPSAGHIEALKQHVDALAALLRNRSLARAVFDPQTLEIRLSLAAGALIFHPAAAYPDPAENMPYMLGDCWEMLDHRLLRITPDIHAQRLIIARD